MSGEESTSTARMASPESPALDTTTASGAAGTNASHPERVGAYRVLRMLGEGGMGAVYLAEQEHPKRQVALKVIRGEHVSDSLLQRFQQETAILARLQHPGIAQIYEAGTATSAGRPQPYFAMEYVAGKSLTKFAAETSLTTRQRLVLLVRVCEAVEHAHQKGVIHRDLKPGNIMVDGAGQPKILDFGIARATDADMLTTTFATSMGQLIGTVPYMSPEQAKADPSLIDTRSDVYALGVIGYELLAGRLPHELRGKPIPEALRIILEDEPPPLSSIDKSLRGDLATIIAKALEREKDRRYQSASDLARDVQRYLSDEPILARPASIGYQASKFARRNRVLVAGVVAVFVALIFGIGATTAAMIYAQGEAAKAVIESNKAKEEKRAREREAALALANAAALSTRHGKWKEALAQYDQSLELGHPDEIGVRIGRLECYSALNKLKLMNEEVAVLSRRTDLGQHAGKVLLHKSWLADIAGPGLGNAESLRHEAISKGLPPADEAHARSFDSQTIPAAIEQLELAVKHDPYHLHSHQRLLMLYFLVGRLDDARLTLAQMRLLEPRSAFVYGGQAIIQALSRDRVGAEASLAEIDRLGAPEEAALFRLGIDLVTKVLDSNSPDDFKKESDVFGLLREFWNVSSVIVRKLGADSSSAEAAIGMQMLNYPLLGRIMRHIGGYIAKDALFLRSAAADEWGEIARIAPESGILTMHGMLLSKAGRFAEAESALVAATKSPSTLSSKRMTYLSLIDVQTQLGLSANNRDAAMLAKASENVRRLRRIAPLQPDELAVCIRPAMEEQDPIFALSLLAEWGQLAPRDAAMLNYRSVAEYKLGAFERAYRTMGEVLRMQPKEGAASIKQFRALALGRLRGELDPRIDWVEAADFEISEYAAEAMLAGDASDANAEPWAGIPQTGASDKLDGVWQARLNVPASGGKWITLTAKVQTSGDRVTIDLTNVGQTNVIRRIAARREAQRLLGWQANSFVPRDSSPWIGLVVGGERVDGIFPSGRFDLRRKLAPAATAVPNTPN